MFCKKCGNQLNPGASFCNKCGAPVENSAQPQVNNYQPNMQQNPYQNTQGYQQPNMYNIDATKPKIAIKKYNPLQINPIIGPVVDFCFEKT